MRTRLDDFISRISAQRDILDHIAAGQASLPDGPILEIGLGNGRTYSHLRVRFPGRHIIAFDRENGAHGSCRPDDDDVVIGDIAETCLSYTGTRAAVVHADIGTGYREQDAIIREWLPSRVVAVLAHDGFAASGLELKHPELEEMPLPASVESGRYFLYRRR
ncbi:methyltransferase protein [Rhizobium etli 8C-3]|uniref:S-adenosylmethionine-dependent methyltransferase n=2 Tax=Rhizobium TaxID=379 RepID=A0A4R3RN97_9HYPH|nr:MULTISPECIES: class I SAM-dependent methyltransferase [Rhizobium]APO73792.1 methyltransferase protein [Rhizobium etli 8C-3]TCU27863.1 S-adenosylmethionine-dependent methyltransferase [Rhizobium azibense]TCU37350.1 S-adenosylmethionine-dependent methyltransferase [Rhizobium azibense]